MVDLRLLSVVVGGIALVPLLVLELVPRTRAMRWRTDAGILAAGLFLADLVLVAWVVLRG